MAQEATVNYDNSEMRLHREMLLWRGLVVLLLLMNLTAEFWANWQRASNWAVIEAGISHNFTAVNKLNDNMKACLLCHVHPEINKFWQDTAKDK
jgi:hypothetical protein